MLRRLFALLIMLGLLAAGLYYWKYRTSGAPPPKLGNLGRSLDDVRLTGSVKAALGLKGSLKPYGIDVTTEDAVVSLRGEVPSEEAKAAAERVAAAVPDVRQVVNFLRVDPSAPAREANDRTIGESFDDHALEVQVRLAFSLHRELKGSDLEVRSFRREVTLQGEVATPAQRRLAVQVAGETAGVAAVKDEVLVKGEADVATRRLAVERALRANPNLKPYAIEVRGEGGRVALLGRVRTGAEKDLAGLLATQVAGGPVENALEVRP